MNTDSETEPPSHKGQTRSILVRAAKGLIAIAVAAGLYFAAVAAMQQWEAESGKVRSSIAEIDRELGKTTDVQRKRELSRQRDELADSLPSWDSVRWDRCALAGLLYAAGLIPPAFLLRRALVTMDQHPRTGTAIAAQLLGHVGKYVPGKAMVIVLRAGALSRDGVRLVPATISVFLETFLMMAVGGAVAGFVVLWLPVPTWIAAMAVGVAMVASLPTLPPILKRVVARATKGSMTDVGRRIDWKLFAAGWAWSVSSWILIGASFTVLITAIPSSTPLPPLHHLYLVGTAAISLAIVIGFASLLPGGAGVRELVVTTVLSVSLGAIHGILAAIAARVLFIIVEALLAAASWLWLRKQSR